MRKNSAKKPHKVGVKETSKCATQSPLHADFSHVSMAQEIPQKYEEIYFEILGFEQSSAIQILENDAKKYNIILESLPSHNATPQAQHNRAQQYGILARGNTESLRAFFEKVESFFGNKLIKGNIAAFIVQKLQQHNKTLSLAESCTGGTLSAMVTSIHGASAVLKGGITAYSIESKKKILGVKDSLFKEHGVYSEECVRAMARGALDLFGSDIAIATSGLAAQDTSENNFLGLPAGMVFTCVLMRDNLPITMAHNYLLGYEKSTQDSKDSRIFVQQEASLQALRLLLSALT